MVVVVGGHGLVLLAHRPPDSQVSCRGITIANKSQLP